MDGTDAPVGGHAFAVIAGVDFIYCAEVNFISGLADGGLADFIA